MRLDQSLGEVDRVLILAEYSDFPRRRDFRWAGKREFLVCEFIVGILQDREVFVVRTRLADKVDDDAPSAQVGRVPEVDVLDQV